MKIHIFTPIPVGTILKAMESNVYEHAYRHTNTCCDNFMSCRIKRTMKMHIVTLIHVRTVL